MRREERSAEAAASRCSPVERLLEQLEVGEHRGQRRAQLVRGVGDELALARERRLGLRRAPRRARAASTPACGASSATSSSASGRGMRTDGSRVRAISRAAAVSSAIGSIARRAVARPASSASAAPPSTPRPRNSFTRLAVAARRRAGARTGRRAVVVPAASGRVSCSSRDSTRQPSISSRRGRRRPEVRRAVGARRSRAPSRGDDADRGVVATPRRRRGRSGARTAGGRLVVERVDTS